MKSISPAVPVNQARKETHACPKENIKRRKFSDPLSKIKASCRTRHSVWHNQVGRVNNVSVLLLVRRNTKRKRRNWLARSGPVVCGLKMWCCVRQQQIIDHDQLNVRCFEDCFFVVVVVIWWGLLFISPSRPPPYLSLTAYSQLECGRWCLLRLECLVCVSA